jgi:hypothetical protein
VLLKLPFYTTSLDQFLHFVIPFLKNLPCHSCLGRIL